MKNLNIGLKEKVNEIVEEIVLGVEETSTAVKFENNHRMSLSFLVYRYGPDIVFDSMGGISLNSADYFLNRLRSRCAKTYQSYFEEKV